MTAGAEIEHIKVALHNILRRRVQLAICAEQCIPMASKRSCCSSRAFTTRSRMAAEDSPFSFVFSSLNSTLLKFICISILSISGPEILRL